MSKKALTELQKLQRDISILEEEIKEKREEHSFYPSLERHRESLETLKKQLFSETDNEKKNELNEKIKKTQSLIKQTEDGIDNDLTEIKKKLALLRKEEKEKNFSNPALADLAKDVNQLVIDDKTKENLEKALSGQGSFEKTGLNQAREELANYKVSNETKAKLSKFFEEKKNAPSEEAGKSLSEQRNPQTKKKTQTIDAESGEIKVKPEEKEQHDRIEALEAKLKELQEQAGGDDLVRRSEIIDNIPAQITELIAKKQEIEEKINLLDETEVDKGLSEAQNKEYVTLTKQLSDIEKQIEEVEGLPDKIQELTTKSRRQEELLNDESAKQLKRLKQFRELSDIEPSIRTEDEIQSLERLKKEIDDNEQKINNLTVELKSTEDEFAILSEEIKGAADSKPTPNRLDELEREIIYNEAAEILNEQKAELHRKLKEISDDQELLLEAKRELSESLNNYDLNKALLEEEIEALAAQGLLTDEQEEKLSRLYAELEGRNSDIAAIEQELSQIEKDILHVLDNKNELQAELNELEKPEKNLRDLNDLESQESEINDKLNKLALKEERELTKEDQQLFDYLETELENIKRQKEEILEQSELIYNDGVKIDGPDIHVEKKIDDMAYSQAENPTGPSERFKVSLDLPRSLEAEDFINFGNSASRDNNRDDSRVSSITEDIRKAVILKQTESLKNWIADTYRDYDYTSLSNFTPQEFSEFLQENKELVNAAFSDLKFKDSLEKAEINGYKAVFEKHHDEMLPVTWEKSGSKDTRSKEIIKDGVTICTLVEVMSNEPLTIADSAGDEIEIKNHRTITFDTHLNQGASGPLDISIAVKDKDGKNIAEKNAVYFTAHYDNKGKLVEVSAPQPIKFLGSGDNALGYIEHQGEIYTLPVTKSNYTEMIKEVRKNKGIGLDLSESVEKPVTRAKDTFMGLSHDSSRELKDIKDKINQSSRKNDSEKSQPPVTPSQKQDRRARGG